MLKTTDTPEESSRWSLRTNRNNF